MKSLSVVVLACLVALAAAKPSGHWDDGHWDGHWDDGHWDGHWDHGHWGGHAHVVHGNGATLIGPSAGHAVIAGPVVHHGYGLGHAWHGHGHHGHGVVVKGPHTVPATIIGPSGKIHADGLYGVGHGHHHW